MRRLILIAILAIILAACQGIAEYSADCTGDEASGYDCTEVSVYPYSTPTPGPTATPYPPTVGTYTLGSTFDEYLEPDTDIRWTILQSPGPVNLIDYNRRVVLAVTEPGAYVIEARWTFSDTEYYTEPMTLTVVLEPASEPIMPTVEPTLEPTTEPITKSVVVP